MVSTNPSLIKDFKVHYCNATEPLWGGRLLVLQSVGNYGTPFIYPCSFIIMLKLKQINKCLSENFMEFNSFMTEDPVL